MNIVIPMAGKSSAFKEEGIDTPKPFIDIQGKSMIQRAYESIGLPGTYYFIVLKEHEEKYGAYNHITNFCPDAKIQFIDEVTSGPAETLYKIKGFIDDTKPLLQTNVDQILDWEPERFLKFLKEKDPDGAVITVNTCNPHYSFVATTQQSIATNFTEKQVISNHGLIGTHYWKSPDLFFSSFINARKKGYTWPNSAGENEIYVSLTYNDLLDRQYVIYDYKFKQHEKQHVVGSLDELRIYETQL